MVHLDFFLFGREGWNTNTELYICFFNKAQILRNVSMKKHAPKSQGKLPEEM